VLPALLLAAMPASPVVLDGNTTCPTPAAVRAELDRYLPRTSEHTDRAELEETPAGLRVRLRRDDGVVVAERTFSTSESCEDLARAAAVVIAAWEADLHPELTAQNWTREAAQPQTPEPRTLPSRPTAPRRRQVEADWGAGPAVSAAADELGAGAVVATNFVPLEALGFRLAALIWLSREHAVAAGSVSWSRQRLAVGPIVRAGLSRDINLDVRLELQPSLLLLEGSGFSEDRRQQGLELALGTGARVALRAPSGTTMSTLMWLDVGAAVFTREQVATLDGSASEWVLPRWEAVAAFGASFCWCR
jgi:hypothetical protein